MKKTFSFVVACLAVFGVSTLRAQNTTNSSIDTVTIAAPDRTASEGGSSAGLSDTGLFEIRRSGPTNFTLIVFYRVSGSASNGVDYDQIAESLSIPAGSSSASILIKPIDDSLVEGPETVVLQIVPSPLLCPGPQCYYYIGSPSNAVVTIADNDQNQTNQPPYVQINAPHDGDQFAAPADITLRAFAYDPGHAYDVQVEFFAGNQSLGFGTFVPSLCPAPGCPYFTLTWSNVSAGDYVLTAKATDADGLSSVSAPVHISVINSNHFGGVNIYATDSIATEGPSTTANAPDTARFTVRRSGDTSESIVVYYSIGGTASNGDDYQKLTGEVTLAQGVSSADILVVPTDDNLVEDTETVVLSLIAPCPQCVFANPPCDLPVGTNCYQIGPDNHATAYIRDNDQSGTNQPPGVNIFATDPTASEGASAGVNTVDTARFTVRRGDTTESIVVYYSIDGTASNGDDYQKLTGEVTLAQGVSSADIVVTPIDDNLIEDTETVILSLIAPCPQCLFAHPACEVPQGTNCYQIGPYNHATAYIRDNDQNRDTNARPTVRITVPSDGAMFPAPSDIEIHAVAVDQNGYVPLVEFFDGNHKIGESQITYIMAPPPGQTTEFTFEYKDVQAGEHVLTARATDDQGAVGPFSTPVRIFVGETNRPPGSNFVTIVATDSVAVEGTFCYSNWWWTTSGDANGWRTNSAGSPTNYCTTNTATFVVRRSGDTTSDLTVPYSIGGTASNGVDYLTLSGQVTIPAGQRGAQIVVVPIADGITEHVETVVLTLQHTAANTVGVTPGYSLGYPSRAAAMILDNSEQRPPCRKLIDGSFHVCVPGTNGYAFCIRTSTDLQNWSVICTNIVTEGAVHFVDPDATNYAHRFYDVKSESNSSTSP